MKNIKYLPLFLMLCFAFKGLVVRPSIEECIIILALSAMAYGYEFFTHKNKINELKQDVKLVSERIDELTKKTDSNQTQIASVKLNSGIRTQKFS